MRWWCSNCLISSSISFPEGLKLLLSQDMRAFLTDLSLVSHTKSKDPNTGFNHARFIRSIIPSSYIQLGLYQNGITPKYSKGSISNPMGWCFESPWAKIVDTHSIPLVNQLLCHRNRSNIVAICPSPLLQLVQAYFPPFGTISMGSHSFTKFSIRSQ